MILSNVLCVSLLRYLDITDFFHSAHQFAICVINQKKVAKWVDPFDCGSNCAAAKAIFGRNANTEQLPEIFGKQIVSKMQGVVSLGNVVEQLLQQCLQFELFTSEGEQRNGVGNPRREVRLIHVEPYAADTGGDMLAL